MYKGYTICTFQRFAYKYLNIDFRSNFSDLLFWPYYFSAHANFISIPPHWYSEVYVKKWGRRNHQAIGFLTLEKKGTPPKTAQLDSYINEPNTYFTIFYEYLEMFMKLGLLDEGYGYNEEWLFFGVQNVWHLDTLYILHHVGYHKNDCGVQLLL